MTARVSNFVGQWECGSQGPDTLAGPWRRFVARRPFSPIKPALFVDDLNDAVGMTPPYVEVEGWEAWRDSSGRN
jgi:hypothetical protein